MQRARGQAAGAAGCRCLGVVRPAGTSRRRGLGGAGRAPGNVDPASSPPQELPTQREPFRPAQPAGPLAPLPVGSVIGWRRGSLARACGCSYKNPRVPALSCSKLATALPSAALVRPERRGLGHSREAGGGGPRGRSHCLSLKNPGDREGTARQAKTATSNSHRVLPRAHGGAEHGRGAA